MAASSEKVDLKTRVNNKGGTDEQALQVRDSACSDAQRERALTLKNRRGRSGRIASVQEVVTTLS